MAKRIEELPANAQLNIVNWLRRGSRGTCAIANGGWSLTLANGRAFFNGEEVLLSAEENAEKPKPEEPKAKPAHKYALAAEILVLFAVYCIPGGIPVLKVFLRSGILAAPDLGKQEMLQGFLEALEEVEQKYSKSETK